MVEEKQNEALEAEGEYKTAVEEAYDYIENFDLLETITNVGNDEVFTPRKTCDMMLDSLPEEVWHNPNYKWLNPATKNGIFEREIAIRLDEGLKEIIPDVEIRRKHILQKMIYSIGQTKFTSNVARRTVYYCSQANRKCDGLRAPDGHFVNGYAIGNGSWFDNEEGNILTPCTDHKMDPKTKKCIHCGMNSTSKYLDANQREKYAYEFIHYDRGLSLQVSLSRRFFKGERGMKFDIIIGNPPYQLRDESGGSSDSAVPIYNKFIDQAISLNPKYLCMIVPSKWMLGGRGLDAFREKMLSDTHICKLYDYENAQECFPANHIDGGVCYFLWDRDYNGKTYHRFKSNSGQISETYHYLKNDYSKFIIRDTSIVSILDKFSKYDSFSSIVSSTKPYGIRNFLFNEPERYPDSGLSEEPFQNSLKIYGVKGIKGGARRKIGYIKRNFPTSNLESINKYKIFFTTSYSTNAINPPEPILGMPNEICTETFLLIGPFDSEAIMKNCLSYINTNFFKFLLYHGKGTMHVNKDVFSLIPLLDFSEKWDDNKINSLFKFSEDEIKTINSLINPSNFSKSSLNAEEIIGE